MRWWIAAFGNKVKTIPNCLFSEAFVLEINLINSSIKF